MGWSKIDTLTFLFARRCEVKVDGRDPMTIRAVMANENFADIVEQVSTSIIKGALYQQLQVHSVHCTTGYHRADVVARVTAAVVNSVLLEDKRCCNVLHLPLCREVATDMHHSMGIAKQWVTSPWAIAEAQWPSAPIERPEAYHAFQACLDSR